MRNIVKLYEVILGIAAYADSWSGAA